MSGLVSQFALGFVNFAVGFGAGWLCRRSGKPVEDTQTTTGSDTAAQTPDVESILKTIQSIEDSADDQAKSNKALGQLIANDDTDGLEQLGIHHRANRQVSRLLIAFGTELDLQDSTRVIVPKIFVDRLADSQRAVADLVDQLEIAEFSPETSMYELRGQLEKMERSNTALRQEVAFARKTINAQASQLTAVESAAYEDFLTKLPNRRAFDQRFAELEAGFIRHGRPLCMLVIDLDHFKTFNDTYGHDCGDAVLTVIAHVIKTAVRTQDFACRYGGEEFAVLGPDTTLAGGKVLAERIRSQVERATVRHGDKKHQATCSIGVAVMEEGMTGEALFDAADDALYAAKDGGRNTIRVHEPTSEPCLV